jgi:hypothetical protein
MGKILAAIFVLLLGGCAITSSRTVTIPVPPSDHTTIVSVTGSAVCHDYFLVYTVEEKVSGNVEGKPITFQEQKTQ